MGDLYCLFICYFLPFVLLPEVMNTYLLLLSRRRDGWWWLRVMEKWERRGWLGRWVEVSGFCFQESASTGAKDGIIYFVFYSL